MAGLVGDHLRRDLAHPVFLIVGIHREERVDGLVVVQAADLDLRHDELAGNLPRRLDASEDLKFAHY